MLDVSSPFCTMSYGPQVRLRRPVVVVDAKSLIDFRVALGPGARLG